MEVEGRIVAHAGGAPLRLWLAGEEVRGAYSVGAMTDPAVRGRGYFFRVACHLYARLEELGFAVVAGFSNRSSYRLMTGPLQRTPVGPFPWAVRLLRPLSLARALLARRGAEEQQPPRPFEARREGELSVAACEPDDPRLDELWARAAPAVRLGCVRDRAFAHWRYAMRADADYVLLLAEQAGKPAAFAAHRMLSLRGLRAGFLVDFVVAEGEEAAGRALLGALAAWCRDQGAELLSALLPGSGPARSVLRGAGFRRIPERLHPQLIRFSVRGLGAHANHPLLSDPAAWYLSWADTDVV